MDSIFTILFFISFPTILEFKLEKISRLPPKKLQVSVELNSALPWFHYWVMAQRIHKNSVLWIDLGFRIKRRFGLRNSAWIQARQGNSCWLVSKQGKYTQLYWFQLLSNLLELKEFSYRKFGSKFSELPSAIRSVTRLTDTWPRANRHRLASRNCEFG